MNKNIYQNGATHNDHSKHIDITLSSAKDLGSVLKAFMGEEAEEVPFVEVETNVDTPTKAEEPQDFGFNRAAILRFIIVKDKDIIANILIELMGPYAGKGNAKNALLPFYCAYDQGWVRRPEYKEFNEAFPSLVSSGSYSNYMPKNNEETSRFHDCDSDVVDKMVSILIEKLKSRKKSS